ncbi:MAG: ECF-type sigma factor [Planctomycetota bacterium]
MGSDQEVGAVSRILRAANAGTPVDQDALFQLVYEELKGIAARQMAGERKGHTLQATALVHEAYLRLMRGDPLPWANRAHFFFSAAEAMRRILVDHARAHRSKKRGRGQTPLPVNVADLAAQDDPESILAVDDAILRLEEQDPRAARIVRLRFYAGLSLEDTAQALGASERTTRREWSYARVRLYRLLGGEASE